MCDDDEHKKLFLHVGFLQLEKIPLEITFSRRDECGLSRKTSRENDLRFAFYFEMCLAERDFDLIPRRASVYVEA